MNGYVAQDPVSGSLYDITKKSGLKLWRVIPHFFSSGRIACDFLMQG